MKNLCFSLSGNVVERLSFLTLSLWNEMVFLFFFLLLKEKILHTLSHEDKTDLLNPHRSNTMTRPWGRRVKGFEVILTAI